MDFFVVPTVTFRLLYVLVILRHERRQIVHVNVPDHPTAAWTAQQVVNAFPWDMAPRYLLRDRDRVYGADFQRRVEALGVEELVTAPRSPWQNPYMERFIGSARRECFDHVVVLGEHHARHVIRHDLGYYHDARTHLSLGKDSPARRPVQSAADGPVAIPQVGGLHHKYQRVAACRIQ